MNFKCPCGMELLNLHAANPVLDRPIIGSIMLCGSCGMPSKVTLTGNEYLTDEEFRALTEEERRDLDFAQRVIKRKLRSN